MKKYDIHKAGGIIIKNRKLLVEKSFNKLTYNAPGGKLEPNETPQDALIRELNEELSIKVDVNDLVFFDSFWAPASGQEDKIIRMDVYIVNKWRGDIRPSQEVEKIIWLGSIIPNTISIGSIFEHYVIPRLKKSNLID